MPALILRLLTLVAVALMPLGMGAAGAMVAQHAPVSANVGHCDEPAGEPAEQSSNQSIDCAMACSMVATTESRVDEANSYLRLPIARPLAARGNGLHPDPATPPPKLS